MVPMRFPVVVGLDASSSMTCNLSLIKQVVQNMLRVARYLREELSRMRQPRSNANHDK